MIGLLKPAFAIKVNHPGVTLLSPIEQLKATGMTAPIEK
jgi:hypothetical protein